MGIKELKKDHETGLGLAEVEIDMLLRCIDELEKQLTESADTIDELVRTGLIEHHPNVELDALTDSMRSITQK